MALFIGSTSQYRQQLSQLVYRSSLIMKPVFSAAKGDLRKVAYAEGEEVRVLHAVQTVVDEHLAWPILIGRPHVIEERIQRAGLRLRRGIDFEVVDPDEDHRYRSHYEERHRLLGRDDVTSHMTKALLRRSTTLIGTLLVQVGDVDALICGTIGQFETHFEDVREVIGLAPGISTYAAMNVVMLDKHTLFIADTYVNDNPSAEQLAEIAQLAATAVHQFGLPPKIALVSHSTFGTSSRPSAMKMREVHNILRQVAPHLEVEGEQQGDAALLEDVRRRSLPGTTMRGSANVLIMPSLDAANIAFSLLKATGGQGVTIGPILLGVAKPVHILTPAATSRGIVNMTALAAAQSSAERNPRS